MQVADADPVISTGMFLVAVDSLWHAAVVCAAGQHMAASVGSGARNVLLNLRTSPSTQASDTAPGESPGSAHKEAESDMQLLQKEVKSFLNVMRKPPVISLHGFMTLKVSLIVTVGARRRPGWWAASTAEFQPESRTRLLQIVETLTTYLCVLLQFTINFQKTTVKTNASKSVLIMER